MTLKTIMHCFKTHASFRAHYENVNEDILILAAFSDEEVAHWLVSDNKVYADIRVGSLERGVKRQWG